MHIFSLNLRSFKNECEVCGHPEEDREHPHIFKLAKGQTLLCECELVIEHPCHIKTLGQQMLYGRRRNSG